MSCGLPFNPLVNLNYVVLGNDLVGFGRLGESRCLLFRNMETRAGPLIFGIVTNVTNVTNVSTTTLTVRASSRTLAVSQHYYTTIQAVTQATVEPSVPHLSYSDPLTPFQTAKSFVS